MTSLEHLDPNCCGHWTLARADCVEARDLRCVCCGAAWLASKTRRAEAAREYSLGILLERLAAEGARILGSDDPPGTLA